MGRDTIDYVVLDALANDLEDIEHILHMANHETVGWRDLNGGRPYTREQVVPTLLRLIRDDLVEACEYSEADRALVGIGPRLLPAGNLDDTWFVLTSRGKMTHATWASTIDDTT